MKKQDYHHHVRYYTPHHFIFYPLILVLLVITIREAAMQQSFYSVWSLLAVLVGLAGWLSFMMRQHYALTIQNRVVRLEMRLRYFQLTGERLEPLEETLGFSRIAALRFASDGELAVLVSRVLADGLSADQIKQQITTWVPDHWRV